MKNIRLGDVLIEFGYITPDQLNTALAYQKEHRDLRVGQALQELGYVNERQVLEALAQRLQLTMIDIEHTNVDVTAVEKVPQELAQKYDMLPIAQSPRALTIAANDPLNYYALEDIRQLTGLEPEIVLAELEPLRRAIRYYYAEVSARKAARTANDSDMAAAQTEDLAIDMTAEGGDLDAPIIRLLNSLVQRAVTTTASDIHIEPFEGETKVRMRIDGVIIDYVTLQRALHQPLIARIKIMSNLDIAEHRIPQDGHFRARLETGPDVNVRVSILPTVFGEKAVLRILSSNTYIKNANHFGMNDETYKRFLPLLNRPNGIVYLTGPTGSGKTTTLYMVLQTIAERQVNRRHHGRRDARRRDSVHLGACGHHGPHGFLNAAHKRRTVVHCPFGGYGCRAVHGRKLRRGPRGSASDAPRLPALRQADAGHGGGAHLFRA